MKWIRAILIYMGYRYWYFYEMEYKSRGGVVLFSLRSTTGFPSRRLAISWRFLGKSMWHHNEDTIPKHSLCNGFLSLKQISYLGYFKPQPKESP